jgi:FKBP-type peptidyl-prolyl cis-trans isomerase 2
MTKSHILFNGFKVNFMANDNTDAAKIVKGDIVLLDFDGWVADSDVLFDTTNAQTAQDNDVFNDKIDYKPLPVLVGGGRIFEGLDEAIESAEIGKETEVVIPAEKAAGQRDPKLVEMISMREFLKQDIEPHVGMEVNIRNRPGMITAVTPGRVRVDFNRPLAGKDLKYKFTVVSKVEGDVENVKAVLEMDYGTSEGFDVTVEDKVVSIVLPDVCKYDQKWILAKYRVVADLREAMDAANVRFIEEYVKAAPAAPEPVEEAAEEVEESEEISPEEISEEKE